MLTINFVFFFSVDNFPAVNTKINKNDVGKLIVEILLNKIKLLKCITFICDNYYYSLFQDEVFHDIGMYNTFFMVRFDLI